MRLYLKKAIITVSIALFFLIIIKFLLWEQGRNNNCIQNEQFLSNLHSVIARTHDVLSHLKIIHFLCYKSLWGQIQQSKLFPWSENAELCMKLDSNTKLNETFMNSFTRANLQTYYNSPEGKYLITDPLMQGAVVELVIFTDTKAVNMLHRTGWKHLLLPPNCEWESLDCFPTYLVEPPLPHGMLGTFIIPIPRGGIEIQKYHYRHTWWKKMEKPC